MNSAFYSVPNDPCASFPKIPTEKKCNFDRIQTPVFSQFLIKNAKLAVLNCLKSVLMTIPVEHLETGLKIPKSLLEKSLAELHIENKIEQDDIGWFYLQPRVIYN